VLDELVNLIEEHTVHLRQILKSVFVIAPKIAYMGSSEKQVVVSKCSALDYISVGEHKTV
jgi:hypothetical protein